MNNEIIVKMIDLAQVIADLSARGVAFTAEPTRENNDTYVIIITGV